MATSYYYQYSSSSDYGHQQELSPPLHLYLFLLVLLLFLGLSCYFSCESLLEGLLDQLQPAAALAPLALLLAVLWLSAGGGAGWLPFIVPERGSLHRAGGSPWGVGLVIVFLVVMVSHQSSLCERWFPLMSR